MSSVPLNFLFLFAFLLSSIACGEHRYPRSVHELESDPEVANDEGLQFQIAQLKTYKLSKRDVSGDEYCEILLNATNGCSPPSPIALFMGGGAASGKSGSWSVIKEEYHGKTCPFVHIDPDAFMVELPAWEAHKRAGNKCAADCLHMAGSSFAERCFLRAIELKRNVLYDATMANPKSVAAHLKRLAANGYNTTRLIGVTRDVITAAWRAWDRGSKENRYVPLAPLVGTHSGFSANFMEYMKLIKTNELHYRFPDGVKKTIVKDGQILDKVLFERFIAQANDTEAFVEHLIPHDYREHYKSIQHCFRLSESVCEHALLGSGGQRSCSCGIRVLMIFSIAILLAA